MDEELKSYLDEMKQELRAHTEAVETRLLREFFKMGAHGGCAVPTAPRSGNRPRRTRGAGRGPNLGYRARGKRAARATEELV